MLPEGVLKVLDVNSTLILQAKKKKNVCCNVFLVWHDLSGTATVFWIKLMQNTLKQSY